MSSKIDKITYDIKEKHTDGKYFFVADRIKTLEAAKRIAEEYKSKRLSHSMFEHIEIWETKNVMTTGFLLKI